VERPVTLLATVSNAAKPQRWNLTNRMQMFHHRLNRPRRQPATDCTRCTVAQNHSCSALLAPEVELKCGCKLPVISDACRTGHKDGSGCMPVKDALFREKHVSVLRDTGCSTVVVRRYLQRAILEKRLRVFSSMAQSDGRRLQTSTYEHHTSLELYELSVWNDRYMTSSLETSRE